MQLVAKSGDGLIVQLAAVVIGERNKNGALLSDLFTCASDELLRLLLESVREGRRRRAFLTRLFVSGVRELGKEKIKHYLVNTKYFLSPFEEMSGLSFSLSPILSPPLTKSRVKNAAPSSSLPLSHFQGADVGAHRKQSQTDRKVKLHFCFSPATIAASCTTSPSPLFTTISRIEEQCEESDMNLQQDVSTELYPIRVGDKFRTVLAETLNEDGSTVTSYFPEGKQKSLADKFEYVMHGLLYKISEDNSGPNLEAVVYISFGGLQLGLKGDATKMGKFKVAFVCEK